MFLTRSIRALIARYSNLSYLYGIIPKKQESTNTAKNRVRSRDASPEQQSNKRQKRGMTCKDRRDYALEKRRGRQDPVRGDNTSGSAISSETRKPKRRVALLMGFCGTGYQGMQINPNAKTIEGDLFKALCEAGAVSADNADDQHKVQLQRAARTDKGVHAAGQAVSLKMIIEDPDIVAKVNQHLPEQIRAWGYVRVIRSFNAKTMCDSRIYEYLLPTYTLMNSSEDQWDLAQQTALADGKVPETTKEEMEEKRKYRVPKEKLQYVRDAFAKYTGTHDFRNFTINKGCTESNSKRYIHWFTVSDPMIIDNTEWLSLKVKGQSFMLHQIRKMVGLVILMARAKDVPLSLMNELVRKGGPRVNVPKAPGLGLLLEAPQFDSFNKRIKGQKAGGATEPVTFEPYQEEMDAFKRKFIYDSITQTEMEQYVFESWAKYTVVFSREYQYINADGKIPDSAIVVPGSERKHGGATKKNEKEETAAFSSDDDEEDTNDL